MAEKESSREMKGKGLLDHLTLQLAYFIFSLGVLSMKYASNFDFGSVCFLKYYFLSILFMAIYAFFWQRVLAVYPLTRAYSWKSLTFLWIFIFSVFLFGENVTWKNFAGAFLIVSGAILVNSND